MTDPVVGFAIFSLGLFMFIINKLMKCGSYAVGYTGILIQGIGIGVIIISFFGY